MSGRRDLGRFALAAAALLPASLSFAACGELDGVRCLPEFEALTTIVRSGEDYVAAGPVARDGVVRPALVRLSRSGEVVRTVQLPWPGTRPPEGRAVAEPRKIIALPKGDIVVLGQARYGDETIVSSWAMRVTASGAPVWSRTFADPPESTVLSTGLFDPASDRIVLAGRLTEGSDDGQCTKWSQSLALVLNAATGQNVGPPLTRGGKNRAGQNREAIIDIAPGEGAGRYVVSGFAARPAGGPGAGCVDQVFLGALVTGQKFALTDIGRFGSPEASEIAFSIKPAGPGLYLMGGYRRDRGGEAPSALAHLVRVRPFGILRRLSTPYPADGSDRTGGDRYRVVVPLPEIKRVLLAGSASTSARSRNQALWQFSGLDLQRVEPPVVASTAGTDVLDAAASPDGTALLVGRWTSDDGGRLGFVRAVSGNPAAATRPAPPRMADIASLPIADGKFRVPAGALSTGGSWAGRQIQAGKEVSLAFTLDTPRTLRLSGVTDRGESDLILLDRAGQLVGFSNFRRGATELLIAALPPGEYTLSLLAHAGATSFQMRLAPAREAPISALALLQRLPEEERSELAGALEAAGYAVAPEPSIALGGESLRSLVAAQEGAGPQPGGRRGEIARSLSALLEPR